MAKKKGILFLPLIAAAGLLLFSGCVGDTANPVFAQGIASPTPTPTPPPGPDPEVVSTQPTPTPTPVPPLIARSDAESAVLDAISDCTESVAIAGSTGGGGGIRLFFDSTFATATRSWVIEVDTADFAVTFGTWRVNEGGALEAHPVDRVADRIANSGLMCQFPTVLLEADPAPPRFVTPSAGLLGDGALIATPEHASMRVWSGIYDCSQNFPDLASFTARQYVNSKWIVEGRSESTQYGLWEVDSITGGVIPVDGHAQAIAESCDATPIVMTETQAGIRVWVATYDCYVAPPPGIESYTVHQDSPHRWVVEGRQYVYDFATGTALEERMLGLWMVETDSGNITGLDAYARNMRAQACFQGFD